jgi:hypothetical protein
MLVASAEKTRSITSFLQNSADRCKALDQQAYIIDCLGSGWEELANELPSSGDYAKVKLAFGKGAEQLKQLTIENYDGMPNKQFKNIARPLAATKSSDEDVAYLNEEITKIYDEIETTLLRSDESSESRKLVYKQISTVLMSNKVLLRSSRDQSLNDPDYSGYLHASRGVINSKVSFTKSSKSPTSEYTTYTSSDLFFYRNKDDSRSTGLSSQVQFEKMLNDKTMLGYFIGGSIGQTKKTASLSSDALALGLKAGAYFVREVKNNLILDGYASLTQTQNKISLNTDIMNAKASYYSQTSNVGLNLTGIVPTNTMELRPKVSLGLIQTQGNEVNFDVTVGSDTSIEQAIHGAMTRFDVSIAQELRIPLKGSQTFLNEGSVGTITPSINCKTVSKLGSVENSCGEGIAIGINTTSRDGLTTITAGTSYKHNQGDTSASVQLRVRTKW